MAEDLLRRDSADNRSDVKLFIACLVIGFIGIVILKFGVNASQFVITAFPCAILGGYIYYVWKTKRYQLRGDRAGDSVYYLGFLYTLLSLGLSLYQFIQDGMGPREIVGNLGIALFTTILGLSGRVVLTQLREDPMEIEESARMELAQAAAEVRAQLVQVVEDVNIFRRTAMQAVNEATQEASRNANDALAKNVDGFTAASREVIERIKEVFTDFGENAKRLNKVSAGTVTALEKLLSKIEAIQAPDTLISAKFDPLAARIATVIQEFGVRTDEQRQAVDAFRANVSATSTELQRVTAAIQETLKDLGGLPLIVGDQARAVGDIVDRLTVLTAAVEATAGRIAQASEVSAGRIAQASEASANNVTSAARNSVKELMDGVGGALRSLDEKHKVLVNQVGEEIRVRLPVSETPPPNPS